MKPATCAWCGGALQHPRVGRPRRCCSEAHYRQWRNKLGRDSRRDARQAAAARSHGRRAQPRPPSDAPPAPRQTRRAQRVELPAYDAEGRR